MAYFSNSSEGEVLYAQCCECPAYEGCPVAAVQGLFNYDQMDKGQEKLRQCLTMLVNDKGECQMQPFLSRDLEHRERKWADTNRKDVVRCRWCDEPVYCDKCGEVVKEAP